MSKYQFNTISNSVKSKEYYDLNEAILDAERTCLQKQEDVQLWEMPGNQFKPHAFVFVHWRLLKTYVYAQLKNTLQNDNEKEETVNMNEVLIIKMFVGGFNDKNIGHEVINFYKPDNCEDKSYIYVPPIGKVAQDKYKGIKKIIMVGPPENYSYPILAIADEVVKFKDDDDRKLTEDQTSYGGKCVKNISFAEDHQDDNAFVHLNFIVPHGSLKQPNRKICLVPAINERFTFEKREECKSKIEKQGGQCILLDSENPQHSVAYCNISDEANKQLKDLLDDVKNWAKYPLKTVALTSALGGYNSNSFLAFIDKEYEEQVYTNMLYSIIKDGMTSKQRIDFSNFILKEVFDGFVINEFFNAILNTFLKDVMKEDSMFYSVFNGEYAINNIKGFIADLFAALKENQNMDDCQMDAFMWTKVFGDNRQFNFKFYLPKTIMTDEKFDNFLHMGPDYILGQLSPIEILQHVLAPLYIALAKANALDKDELKNFGLYQMGLH